MRRLLIKRKGHFRKTKRGRIRVKGSKYFAKDRGKKGRGPKIIIFKRKSGFSKDKPISWNVKRLSKSGSPVDLRRGIKQANALYVLNKRTNKSLAKKAKAVQKQLSRKLN